MSKIEESSKRPVAYKCRIIDLKEGSYIKEEGWQPNYVMTQFGEKISRVNLMATVVSVEEATPSNTVMIDDGSATITLRSFEEMKELNRLVLGEVVNIIGKPREFGDDKYLVPEIIRSVKDNAWLSVRRAEILLQRGEKGSVEKKEEMNDNKKAEEKLIAQKVNPFQLVYNLIKECDKEDGAEISKVIELAKIKEAEDIIKELLKEGEIFEIRSGRVKVLE